jgi:dephospho-CoA kinase
MLIGVVGLNGSGKDTFANYLVSKYNFSHVDIGQSIRNELKKAGKDFKDRNEMLELGNRMRHMHGADYWCGQAIMSMRSEDMVITSIRNPAEAELILKRNCILVEIHADRKTRFNRTVERVRSGNESHGDIQSFEDFIAREEKELRSTDPANQQLLKCISMAKYRIPNNGTEEQLHDHIDRLIKGFTSATNRPL